MGSTGSTGALTQVDRMEILTVVEEQIDDIYRHLDIQMQRMARMQAQLDDVRAKVRRIMGAA